MQEPLLLYACGFEALRFRRTERAIENTVAVLATEQHRHLIAAALTSSILARLASDEKVRDHNPVVKGNRGKGVWAGPTGKRGPEVARLCLTMTG